MTAALPRASLLPPALVVAVVILGTAPLWVTRVGLYPYLAV